MSAGRTGDARRSVRWRSRRAWAASILAGGLLLFLWPFVRTPPLSIGLTYAHLLGSWAAVVVALAVMSVRLARSRRRGEDD